MPKGPKSQKRPAGVIGNAPDRVGRRRTKGEKQLQAESISLTPVFPQIRSYEKGSPPFGSDPPLASAPWPDHLPVFFMVSTIAVFERAIATETGINSPLLSIPPLFPSTGLLCFQGGGGGRRSGATSRCPGVQVATSQSGEESGTRFVRRMRTRPKPGRTEGRAWHDFPHTQSRTNKEHREPILLRAREAATFRSRAWAPRV